MLEKSVTVSVIQIAVNRCSYVTISDKDGLEVGTLQKIPDCPISLKLWKEMFITLIFISQVQLTSILTSKDALQKFDFLNFPGKDNK